MISKRCHPDNSVKLTNNGWGWLGMTGSDLEWLGLTQGDWPWLIMSGYDSQRLDLTWGGWVWLTITGSSCQCRGLFFYSHRACDWFIVLVSSTEFIPPAARFLTSIWLGLSLAYLHTQMVTDFTCSVANTVKRAILIWLSIFIFRNAINVMSAVGMVLVTIGVALFNGAKLASSASSSS